MLYKYIKKIIFSTSYKIKIIIIVIITTYIIIIGIITSRLFNIHLWKKLSLILLLLSGVLVLILSLILIFVLIRFNFCKWIIRIICTNWLRTVSSKSHRHSSVTKIVIIITTICVSIYIHTHIIIVVIVVIGRLTRCGNFSKWIINGSSCRSLFKLLIWFLLLWIEITEKGILINILSRFLLFLLLLIEILEKWVIILLLLLFRFLLLEFTLLI